MDADASHNSSCFDGTPASSADREAVSVFLDARHGITCQHFHTFLTIIDIQEICQVTGKDTCANCICGEDHRHFFADYCQRGGDLRTNKTSANDDEMIPMFGHTAQMFIVLKVAVVNDFTILEGQM